MKVREWRKTSTPNSQENQSNCETLDLYKEYIFCGNSDMEIVLSQAGRPAALFKNGREVIEREEKITSISASSFTYHKARGQTTPHNPHSISCESKPTRIFDFWIFR
jgi:hypothetical protein